MFEHDCLDTYFLGVLYACVYIIVYTCLVQLCMFHMERHSRNIPIIIITICKLFQCGSTQICRIRRVPEILFASH